MQCKWRTVLTAVMVLVTLILFNVGVGQTALLFYDDFDSDYATSFLNFNSFTNWDVSDGTVDYLKNYGGIDCVGGVGGCVDLDGTSMNSGR